MPKFLSSVFSFKTFKIKTIPTAWWYTLLVAVTIFILFEWGARQLMAPFGEYKWAYWDTVAMNKFEWYRDQSLHGKTPEVIAIGDSTGARDFSPDDFIKETDIPSAYNLAWPANFPMALRISTFPLLEHGTPPKYVFLFQSPGSYVDSPNVIRFEESILSSPLGKKYSGKYLTTDFIYLSRIYTARFLLIQHWVYDHDFNPTSAHMGFMPVYQNSNEDNKEVRIDIKEGSNQLSCQRLKTITELVRISHKRNFQLILVIPPMQQNIARKSIIRYKKWLEENALIEGFKVLDYSNSPFLGPEHFWNAGHLNHKGAKIFSSQLGKDFSAYLLR